MSEPKLSLHIISSRQSGGAESFYLRLIHALSENEQPVVAINKTNSIVSRELLPGIRQAHVSMRGAWDILSKRKIQKIIRHYCPAVVQTYMSRATALTKIAPQTGVVHLARLGGYYNLKYYRHAHAWVGNTRGVCDYLLQEGLPPDRVFHVNNFVASPEEGDVCKALALRNNMGIPDDAFIILSVGRLHAVKGFEELLNAFSLLPVSIKGKRPYLIILGDGDLNTELKQQAVQLGIAERVIFPGWAVRPGPYYRLCDAYVSAARQETLGNTMLEAWAYERPVIATRTQGAKELITAEKDGLLVDAETLDEVPAKLAERLSELISSEPEALQALGRHGAEKVARTYSKTAVLSRYQELYTCLAP